MDTQPNPILSDSLWIIPLLPKRLPGQIRKKIGNPLIIEPLVKGLPLINSTVVEQFFAPAGEAKEKDFVTFEWEKPGYRGFDQKKSQDADPRAINVQVVTEGEAYRLAEDIRTQIGVRLRENLQQLIRQNKNQLESSLKNLQRKAEELAEELVKDKRQELETKLLEVAESKNWIQFQQEELDQELKKLEQEKQDLQAFHLELDRRKAEIISQSEKSVALKTAIEPYRLAIPLDIEELAIQSNEVPHLPEKLASTWTVMLEATGLLISQNIAISYLLSLLSACYSGSLVLLNGPVGVGKTSIIRNSAQILGGTNTIIPVRPAWLDPSDLLGFFDPLSETFRPSPFLTALKNAKTHPNRLCLVCLDELNLARIENYGADLLSSLEYSRSCQKKQLLDTDNDRRGLLLYSSSIETQLWEEARFLHEAVDRTQAQNQRLKHIQTLLKDYPSTFTLSPNLVLLGTLNSDETTYDLSPKVIDRSYVITYPPANLDRARAVTAHNFLATSVFLSITSLQQAIESAEEFSQTSSEWQLILKWNQHYLSTLGIPLGHRAAREYQVFHTVATTLGLSSQDCMGHFIFTKLLPRVSFFKDNTTNELLDQWLREIEQTYRSYDPGDVLSQLGRQLQDKRRANVRYWTKA